MRPENVTGTLEHNRVQHQFKESRRKTSIGLGAIPHPHTRELGATVGNQEEA